MGSVKTREMYILLSMKVSSLIQFRVGKYIEWSNVGLKKRRIAPEVSFGDQKAIMCGNLAADF